MSGGGGGGVVMVAMALLTVTMIPMMNYDDGVDANADNSTRHHHL